MRVITATECAERKAETLVSASPDERRRAAQRFEEARASHAEARARLRDAARLEADAQRQADAALAAYDDARVEARRATVHLRQRQREATSTKLAVRRALEWVARLEALDDDADPRSNGSAQRWSGPAGGAADGTESGDGVSPGTSVLV